MRCYARSQDDICAAVTTNEAYPSRIALECVTFALQAFKEDYPSLHATRTGEVCPSTRSIQLIPVQDEDLSCPHTQRLFAKYLKPENDKILQIKRDLEETKVQLKRDIEYVSSHRRHVSLTLHSAQIAPCTR